MEDKYKLMKKDFFCWEDSYFPIVQLREGAVVLIGYGGVRSLLG
jgi:hypothetical protein